MFKFKLCHVAAQLLLVLLICDLAKQVYRPQAAASAWSQPFGLPCASAELFSSHEQQQQQQAITMRRQPANKEQPFGE